MATPVFAGAKEGEIKEYLKMAGLPEKWSNLIVRWANRASLQKEGDRGSDVHA